MKNKGVTLIALAVTIVVMLILAGVTISVLNGENGIVKQAQKAKEESKIKELKEKVRIDIAGKRVENINGELRVSVLKEILDKYFDNVPVETQITSETKLKAKEEYGKYEMKISDIDVGEITYETSYTIFKDVNGEQVPIPEGYIVSENSDENIVNKGLVISDSRGNEYVWISCTVDSSSNKLQYKRTEWGVEKDGTDNSRAIKDELTLKDIDVTYSKTDTDNGINEEISKEIVAQINAEKESIKKYGGYYIGRYEVGKDNKTAVIKAEQEPYVNIKWSKAYELAKGIGGGEGATTYLCSSYSWDTAINFIQNTTGKNYATSIIGFNGNWKSQEVKDSSGKVIKPVNTAQRLNTGLTTALCNIYDMGGNVGEFTTELNPGTSETVVLRGGDSYDNFPAGHRWDNISGANSYCGFRATLFLK
jgi:hypothetical protein